MRRVEMDFKVIAALMGGLSVNGHDIQNVDVVVDKIKELVTEAHANLIKNN